MDLAELTDRLNGTLDVGEWEGADPAVNGLQVGPDGATVEHAAFAVDAAPATFAAAADAGADVLVVHHGISWGGIKRVTGTDYDRLGALFDHDLALYAAHLPLDAHPEHGNATRLADRLGLRATGPFGRAGPGHVGRRARADEPLTVADLRAGLSELETAGRDVRVLGFGPEAVTDVAIVTGSGTDWIREARAAGVDALVTGEGKGRAYHEARDAGLNLLLAGHYATETLGVRALRELVDGWGLDTSYHAHPTGL